MEFDILFDPNVHCRMCKGCGSHRDLGSKIEVSCALCSGFGMKYSDDLVEVNPQILSVV